MMSSKIADQNAKTFSFLKNDNFRSVSHLMYVTSV